MLFRPWAENLPPILNIDDRKKKTMLFVTNVLHRIGRMHKIK